MKLVAIEHQRCDEYEHTKYYIVPEGLDEADVNEAVEKAQESYLAALIEVEGIIKPEVMPEMSVLRIKDDGLTVGELKARWKKYENDLDAYRAAQRKVAGSFDDHLHKLGFISLFDYSNYQGYKDGTDYFRVQADWGHRHGQVLEY